MTELTRRTVLTGAVATSGAALIPLARQKSAHAALSPADEEDRRPERATVAKKRRVPRHSGKKTKRRKKR